MINSHQFFRNINCKYFPCHRECNPEQFNCLFCYCPLYDLGDQCGGNFDYTDDTNRVKNCANCTFPHDPANYEKINAKLKGMNDAARTLPSNDRRRAVVLLSGGLDSTTAAAWGKANQYELFALTINYNQRHRCELEAARRVGEFLGLSHHVFLDVDLSAFGGSSLTANNLEVRQDVPLEMIGQEIPNTYVPARNTVFLSLALAYAETISAENIILGINAADYSGYPDCRPEYLDAFAKMSRLATKAGVEGTMQLRFHAPLMTLGKREIIELGMSLGVDFSLTHTCYSPTTDAKSCGRCESCLLRLKGFQEVGIADPIVYA